MFLLNLRGTWNSTKEKKYEKAKEEKIVSWIYGFYNDFYINTLGWIYLKDIFAADGKEEISADKIAVSEDDVVESENTENSTTFDIGDGRKKVVYYGGDVRYEDENGKLVDYDPSLTEIKEDSSENGESLENYAYENTEGDKKQYLPQSLSTDTPILMENENYSLRFAPLIGNDENNGSEELVNLEDDFEKKTEQNDFANVEEVKSPVLRDETTTDAYEQEIEKPLTAVYDAGENMDIEYQSMEDGVKERIVLEEKPESGVFQYEIQADGLEVRKNSTDEGLTFYEPDTENIVAFMAAPNMNDASGNAYSEDITCDIKEKEGEDGKYILTMSVDSEYLSDSKRQYPVTIDPTMTWKGNDSLRDVYIISGSTYGDVNFYDSGVVAAMAGKTSKGIYHTYLMMMDLYANLKGCYIDSAALTMYETASSKSGQTISAHKVNSSWKSTELTWNSRPLCNSAYYSTIKTSGKAGNARTFDLTSYVKGVAKGNISNYGIMLRNQNETSSYAQFYGSRNAASAKRPKLSVVYYSKPTTASKVSVSPMYGKKGSKAVLKWEGIQSSHLSYVQYRVVRVSSSGEEQEELVPYSNETKIGNTSSGSKEIVIPDCETYNRTDYRFYVRGVDTQGNKGTGKGTLFHMDSVAPTFEIGSVSMTPVTSEDEPDSERNPKISWKAIDANLLEVKYRIKKDGQKIAENAFKEEELNSKTITEGKSESLPKEYFGKEGDYIINLIASDKAGNIRISKVLHYYVSESLLSMESYVPVAGSMKIRQQYGKNTISWETKEKVPNNIEYRIYRGTTKDFTINDDRLVAEGIQEKHWTDMNTADGQTYYYKVKAVQVSSNNKDLQSLTATDVVKADAVKESFYETHLGNKDWMSYFTFDTPVGNGTLEESEGNFSYSQTDASLPAAIGEFEFTRHYNSQSEFAGMFGKGWSDSFHKELNISSNGNIYFTDSDGTSLKFEKNGSTYKCKESADYELYTMDSKEISVVSEEEAEVGDDVVSTVLGWAAYEIEDQEEDLLEVVKRHHSYTLKDGDILYRFNKKGRLVSKIDANGNFLLYNYNSDGTLKEVISQSGKKITFEYGKKGYVTKAILPDNTFLSYEYNENEELIHMIHMDSDEGNSVDCSYTYGNDGMIKVSDFQENEYTIEYAGEKVDKIIYPDGETYDISYGNGTTKVSKTGAGENKELYTTSTKWDISSGKKLSQTDAEGFVTTYAYEYSANPYLLTKTEIEQPYQYLKDQKVIFDHYIKTETTEYDADERIKREISEQEDGSKEVTEYSYEDDQTEWTEDATTEEYTYVERNGQKLTEESKEYTFDENGNMLVEQDKISDEIIERSYDEDGNITREVTSRKIKGLLKSSRAILETDTSSYDEDGNIIEEKMESGTSESEEGEESSEILSSSRTVYDDMGREIQTKDEDGNVIQTKYDWLGRSVEVTTIKKDENGNNISSVESSNYYANGMIKSETDAQGIKSIYQYDEQGRLLKTTVSAGENKKVTSTSYGYETIDINEGVGTKKVYAYKETKTSPEGTEITYKNSTGEVIRVVSSDTTMDYIVKDGQTVGNVSNGKIELTLCNQKGQETTSIKNAETSEGSYVVGEDSVVIESEYDDKGNVVAQTDAMGVCNTYAYNIENQLTDIRQDANGKKIDSTVSYTYDEDGNSNVIITDANGHKNITTSNEAGLTIEEKSTGDTGESIETSYIYDHNGNVVKQIFSNGNHKEYEYSSRNLLVEVRYYDGNDQTLKTTYAYDEQERMTRMSDYEVNGEEETPYRHTLYGYDAWGRKEWEAEVDTNVDYSVLTDDQIEKAKIKYGYNDSDQVTNIRYAKVSNDIQGIKIAYDTEGRIVNIKSVIKLGTATKEKLIRSYTYDKNNNVSKVVDYSDFAEDSANEIIRTYQYDSFDRILSMNYKEGDKVIGNYEYQYDKNSNIVQAKELDSSVSKNKKDQIKDYTYDSLGRLIKSVSTDNINNNSVTTSYSYDNVGNRTKMVKGSETTEYTYNGLNQLVRSIGKKNGEKTEDSSYTYDKNGNEQSVTDIISNTVVTNSYDPDNRLVSRTLEKNESTVLVQENKYNGQGQRIEKTENGISQRYHYEDGSVSYVTNEDDVKTMQYLALGGEVIASEQSIEGTTNTYLYNKDVQNSTTSLLDKTGAGTTAYDYDDFGETKELGEDNTGNEICYTGGIYDKNTGLYYLNARYYNPEDGRFLTQDTYRGETNEPDTYHLYAYCKNNPINYADPSGHVSVRVVNGIVNAIAGVMVDTALKAFLHYVSEKGSLKGFRVTRRDVVTAALSGLVDGILLSSKLKRNAQVVAGAVKSALVSYIQNRKGKLSKIIKNMIIDIAIGGAVALIGGDGIGRKYWNRGLMRKGSYSYKTVTIKYGTRIKISSRNFNMTKKVFKESVIAMTKASIIGAIMNGTTTVIKRVTNKKKK